MGTLRLSNRFRSLVVPLLLVALAGLDAHAAVWRPGVLEGGSVRALAQDPASGRIYAGGGRGLVFASDDGGANWQRVNETPLNINGVTDLAAASGALVTIQQSPRQLLRSTDGGATWTDVTAALGGASPVLVERDVAVPSRLYLATSAHGVLVSQDSGATWTSLSNGLADGGGVMPSLNGFSQSPARPQTLYASSQLRGLFRSTNGGANWVALEGEPTSPRQVAADMTARDTVFMLNSNGVHRSTDRGDSWEQIRPDLVDRLGFSPGGTLLVGLVDQVGVLRSTDGGTTFTPVPLDLNPVSLSDLLALNGSSRLLAATPAGVLASSDDGVTWSLANDGLRGVLVSDLVVAGGDGTRLYLDHDGGFERSDDRGATWTRLDLGDVGEVPGQIVASAQSATTVLASLDGPFGARVPVSTDAGEAWSSPPALAEGFGSTAVTVDRLSDQRVGLALYGDPSLAEDFGLPEFAGGVYLSTDGGTSWQQVYLPDGDLAVFQPTSLVIRGDLIVAGYLGARADDFSFLGAVVRSDDGGVTWSEVFQEDGFVFPSLALDPVDPALLYLAGSPVHRLQRSLDGGETWTPLAGLPDATVFDLATDSARGDIVLVAMPSGGGIHRSTDRGATWETLPAAPEGEHFRQVASSVDGTIHAATNLGVYTLVPDDEACEGPNRLCLTGGRFLLEVAWRDSQGGSGSGVAETLTSDTGYFWFFDDANVELVVKVLDARVVNGHFWVFYGSLTDVEFRLRVTDLETGQVVEYENPQGEFASRGDTAAFADLGGVAGAAFGSPSFAAAGLRRTVATNGTCAADATSHCLADGRFRVAVEWADSQGGSGSGQAVPITSDTGYFWFFDDANVELVVKVLDARPVNGHFWVFYGALTDVGYTLTVTDTETGDEVTYENPSGTFGSRGDTAAFPE